MAGFESTRVGPVGEAVREWRWGRFTPLYAAGILLGIAVGVGVATWPGDEPSLSNHVSIAPAGAEVIVDAAPAVAIPEGSQLQANPAVTTELPLEYYPAMEVVVAEAAPIAEPTLAEPVPAPAAAPIAPAAAKPAVQAPAEQPAPAVAQAAPAAKPNFYVPEVSSGPASALESQLLQYINAERATAGLAPYTLEAGLTKVARTRSQQLIDQNYFAHRDPYGYSMYVELLAYFGYTSYAWAGENLALNNWPAETAADEAIRGLMASPTHRANILAGDFTRIGIGEVTTSDRRHYFTMIFLS